MGVATAAVRSVAVTIHAVSAAAAPSRRGNCGTSGTTSVCCSDTVMPARARTATKAGARVGVLSGSSAATGEVLEESMGSSGGGGERWVPLI